MSDSDATVIARHRKTGRWVAVRAFKKMAPAAEYANTMNGASVENESHGDFVVVVGDWDAAKAACRRRNGEKK